MQEPANMPLERMCHVLEMKQVSITFQFHNICWEVLAINHFGFWSGKVGRTEILQPPPMSIAIAAEDVAAAASAVAVPIAISIAVEEAWFMPLISILKI